MKLLVILFVALCLIAVESVNMGNFLFPPGFDAGKNIKRVKRSPTCIYLAENCLEDILILFENLFLLQILLRLLRHPLRQILRQVQRYVSQLFILRIASIYVPL